MNDVDRQVLVPVALLAVGSSALLLRDPPGVSVGRLPDGILLLQLVAAAGLVVAGTLPARARDRWPWLLVGVAWLVPAFAGEQVQSWAVRSVSDAVGWALPALLLTAAATTVGGAWSARLRTGFLALAGAGAATRLLLVDPFWLAGCRWTCEPNRWALVPRETAPTFARWAGAVAVGVVVGAALMLVASALVLRRRADGARRGWSTGLEAVTCCLTAASGAVGSAIVLHLADVDPRVAGPGPVAVVQLLVLGAVLASVSGRLRRRRMAQTLAALARPLEEAARRGSSVAVLREATHDPTLELWFWAPGRGEYVAADGTAFSGGAPGRQVTRIARAGRPVALVHHAARMDGDQLDRAIGPAARLVLQNEQLRVATLAELGELRSSRLRVVQRAEIERRRLERNLHDGAQQRVVSLALMTRLLAGRPDVGADDPGVRRAQLLARSTAAELRRVARRIYPAALVDAGLPAAVADLADTSGDLVVDVGPLPARRLPPVLERTAYLVVLDALESAKARHASTATVSGSADEHLVLVIEDDGQEAHDADPDGLLDLVETLRGRWSAVRSPSGTRVVLEAPCAP